MRQVGWSAVIVVSSVVGLALPAAGAAAEPAPPSRGTAQPGYRIDTGEGDALTVGGYVHADARTFVGSGHEAYTDQLLLRQVRPVLEGTLRRHFNFRLLPDFAGGKVVVQEAWGELAYVPWLKVRFGKLKVPVSLERLQNSNAVIFAERAFPSSLAPNRDLGVQVAGDVAGVLSYALGVFDGAVDNGINEGDTDGSKEAAGRLFLTPFAPSGPTWLKGLGAGVSGTWGSPTGTASAPQVASYLSPGQNTIFSYAAGSTGGAPDPARTVVANGERVRWDIQGFYYAGPLGLQAEYIRSIQQLRKGTATTRADHWAWATTASLVVTGENATFGILAPDRPLDPAQGQWGAVELVARYQQVAFDDDVFVNAVFADPTQQVRSARSWGAGVNWYVDRFLRFQADYDRTSYTGGASSDGAEADRTPEQVVIVRAQVVF